MRGRAPEPDAADAAPFERDLREAYFWRTRRLIGQEVAYPCEDASNRSRKKSSTWSSA